MKNVRLYGKPPYGLALLHGGPGARGSLAGAAAELGRSRGVLEPLQTRLTIDALVQELHEQQPCHGGGQVGAQRAAQVYIFGGLMIFTGITAMFTKYYLPEQLYLDILNAKWLCITLVLFLGISSVICAVKDKKRGVFYTYVIFMTLLSALGTKELFNIDYKFGQNDIMEYAKIAKDNGNDVVIFGHGRRYSLLYYYGGPVTFEVANNYPYLDKALKNKNTLFIIKKKEYHEIAKNEDDFEILKIGRKYLLIRGKKDGQKGALGLE